MTTKRQALGRGLAALIPTGPSAPGGTPAAPPSGGEPSGGGGGDGTLPGDPGAPAGPPSIQGGGPPPSRPLSANREGLRIVGIEEVHPAPSQPRKAFDDVKLNELATSIRNQGLIQPLVVRNRDHGLGGGYEIIAGERRWRAAQRAGLHTIPVVVREVAPDRAFELAMVENLQREDLNPIEEAEGFERLIREFDYTQESLASRIGKDRSSVANALRLLRLPPAVRNMVIDGRLSMGHARAILGLEASGDTPTSAAENMERMGRRVVSRELSVRQVEELVRKERAATRTDADRADSRGGGGSGATASDAEAPAGPTATGRGGSASARDLATRLSRAFATRVRVVESGAGRGHIEIHYGSLDQLDGLLVKLMDSA
jgi:ParB family chromosome partitioning protein